MDETMNENSVDMQVFYPTGKPGGEVVVESPRLKGRAFAFSRDLCSDNCKEHENRLRHPCVYVLWDSGREHPKAYVGESDTFLERVDNHLRTKDYWTRIAIYTASNLTKTDVLNFQAWLVQFAKEAGRCDLQNTQDPRERTYSSKELEHAAKRHFNDVRRFFLPLVGCNFFNPAAKAAASAPKEAKDASAPLAAVPGLVPDLLLDEMGVLSIQFPGKNVDAKGREDEKGFVVLKDSTAALEATDSAHGPKHKYIVEKRDELIRQGVLERKGGVYIFSQDYLFNSSSIAASVVWGGSVSGPDRWKDAAGRTLNQLQQR